MNDISSKKSYYELMNEISSNELFDGLIGYGLFSEKIPPFLTAENFLNFCKTPPTRFTFDEKPKKYIHYESMRNINVPRVLAIPNPIAYYNQCKVLSDNWDKLLEYFKVQTQNQEHKISRIHIRKLHEKKNIFEMKYESHIKDDYPELELRIGKKYIIKADVSNCFPSIYTHSLSWALVGKKKAKEKSKPTDSDEWFNKIDKTTRNLKDGETHGILIGSHGSNLISEIVLTAVDKAMYDKGYRYTRHIDDYTCYVETRDKAEKFLVDLSTELKQYGLMLNHKKTEILKLPFALTENWVRKLNSFAFSNDNQLKLSEVRAYLDIALDLVAENKNNGAILYYAFKVLTKKQKDEYARNYFIKTFHHLILLYPYLVSLSEEIFLYVFVDAQAQNASNYEEKIRKIIEDMFNIGKDRNFYEVMSYALFFSLQYCIKLTNPLFEEVKESNDAILLLLAYLHDKTYSKSSSDFNRTTIGKKYKDLAITLKEDIDEYWIFVYEVLTEGLLCDEWTAMKKAKVTFIKKEFQGKKCPKQP